MAEGEEKKSLLYKLKPISDRLPAVTKPEGHVHFRTKMSWIILILVLYFAMTNDIIYGLDPEQGCLWYPNEGTMYWVLEDAGDIRMVPDIGGDIDHRRALALAATAPKEGSNG